MAGLLKYFSVKWHQSDGTGGKRKFHCLLDPNGQLNKVVLSSSIEATNTIVCETMEKHPHGLYISLTLAQKYSIGKRTAKNRVAAMLCYYAKAFPDLQLNETTIQRFTNPP